MAIQKKAELNNIKQRTWMNYSPEALAACKYDNLIECTAEYCLEHIKPAEIPGLPGKWICFDTETEPTGVPANMMPSSVIRRWIKRGSKEIPNDFPFCYSICDGTTSFVIYDRWDKGFKELKKLKQWLIV